MDYYQKSWLKPYIKKKTKPFTNTSIFLKNSFSNG